MILMMQQSLNLSANLKRVSVQFLVFRAAMILVASKKNPRQQRWKTLRTLAHRMTRACMHDAVNSHAILLLVRGDFFHNKPEACTMISRLSCCRA